MMKILYEVCEDHRKTLISAMEDRIALEESQVSVDTLIQFDKDYHFKIERHESHCAKCQQKDKGE